MSTRAGRSSLRESRCDLSPTTIRSSMPNTKLDHRQARLRLRPATPPTQIDGSRAHLVGGAMVLLILVVQSVGAVPTRAVGVLRPSLHMDDLERRWPDRVLGRTL